MNFAWRVTDARRGARQGAQGGRLARRRPARRGPRPAVGQRHRARRPAGLPPLRRAGARRRHRVQLVGGDERPDRRPRAVVRAGHLRHRTAGAPTGSPAGFGRGRPGRSPRSTPTCAPWCDLRPAPSCGPPPTWPPPTSSSSGPTGRWPPPGPCFSFPDESYYQATDLTHLLRAGRPNAVGLLHHWYGAGNGRPAAVPGALLQLSVHHADGSHEVYGTDGDWKERAAEWQPAPGAQHPGPRLRRDRRRPPVARWAGPSPATTTATGPRRRCSAAPARRPSPPSTPSGPGSPSSRWPRSRSAPWPTAPSWSTTARSSPAARRWPSATGQSGRTVAMHVGYLFDPDGQVSTTHGTQGTDLSLHIHPARRRPAVRRLHLQRASATSR